MSKTFILGVGAQKGGTTWLHRQLDSNHNIDMGFQKEYHVFDSLEGFGRDFGENKFLKDPNNRFRRNRIKAVQNLINKDKIGKNRSLKRAKRNQHAALQLSFIDNIENYFNYFDYLYLKNENIEAVGDITPNYAILSPKTFRLIKKSLEERGFEIKVFYLMRDPVERVWSSARMRKRKMRKKDKNASYDEFQKLIDPFGNPKDSLQSRYERTIINLEKVFDPSNIFFGFYEDLFTRKTFKDIQSFLDLDIEPFDPSFIVNASPKGHSIPEDINCKMVQHFHETYNFILNRYGEKMRNLWQGYSVL